jgi:hypothetical protein
MSVKILSKNTKVLIKRSLTLDLEKSYGLTNLRNTHTRQALVPILRLTLDMKDSWDQRFSSTLSLSTMTGERLLMRSLMILSNPVLSTLVGSFMIKLSSLVEALCSRALMSV